MLDAERTKTLRDVIAELAGKGLLQGGDVSRIERHLASQPTDDRDPWFAKLLMTLGAWLAAICFVVCLGIADLLGDEWWILLNWGSVFLVAATLLRAATEHIFPVQTALAFSSVGHGFILAGAASLFQGAYAAASAAAAAVLLCALLYMLYQDDLHRFLSCVLAVVCLATWIVAAQAWPLIDCLILVEIVTVGTVFIARPDLHTLRPLGYAMAFSLPAILFLVVLPREIFPSHWSPANAILAAALIWLFQSVAGGWSKLRSEPLTLATAATVCLACFTTPGVLAALGLMILGYSRDDRCLLAIGVLFFPVFIVVFYYEWETTLLVKWWIMAGSGAVLLAARWLLKLRSWAAV